MKADKLGMWLINLLLSAAFAFSLLVLMEQMDVTLADMEHELALRHR